jgi:hypothetical protein
LRPSRSCRAAKQDTQAQPNQAPRAKDRAHFRRIGTHGSLPLARGSSLVSIMPRRCRRKTRSWRGCCWSLTFTPALKARGLRNHLEHAKAQCRSGTDLGRHTNPLGRVVYHSQTTPGGQVTSLAGCFESSVQGVYFRPIEVLSLVHCNASGTGRKVTASEERWPRPRGATSF